MAWCGLLINTKNLEIRSDYARYTNKSELRFSQKCVVLFVFITIEISDHHFPSDILVLFVYPLP